MQTIKTVIFCGGRGAITLLQALLAHNRNNESFRFDISVVVNAYDNGLSTGKLRNIFNILGPSDVRKNMENLLDISNKDYSTIFKFFSIRTSDEWELSKEDFPIILEDIAKGNFNKERSIYSLYKKLPDGFQKYIQMGIIEYLNSVTEKNLIVDYTDFSFMNIVLAGLIKINKGNITNAIEALQEVLPLQGKVFVNSDENLFLYGIREHKQNPNDKIILDESEIVANRSSIRLKNIFLLSQELTKEEFNFLRGSTEEEAEKYLQEKQTFPRLNVKTREAIQYANLIIYAPGTQYSSLLPTYLTDGLGLEIAQNTKARKIFFTNIGEDFDITNYSASEIVYNAYSLLSQKKETILLEDLFTSIYINKPGGKKITYIQPNLSFFEREFKVKPTILNIPKTYQKISIQKNNTVSIVCSNFEDNEFKNRGKHSPSKLLNAILYSLRSTESRFFIHNELLTHGSILFDVDETILDVMIHPDSKEKYEESLLESPMRFLLVELLEKGFKLCAITGNDIKKFTRRFTENLFSELKKRDEIHLLANFEVYANGAATHLMFDRDGKEIYDQEYNESNNISFDDIQAIEKILNESIVYFYNAEENSSIENFQKKYSLDVWKYRYDSIQKRWFENDKQLPYIESRALGSMVTLKPLPSPKHLLHSRDNDLRSYILEIVKSKFTERFGTEHEFTIKSAGWSSIDITKKGISKAKAVQNYLYNHKLKPEEVIYFGNEFRAGGNDQSVIDQIEKITVISVNQPIEETFFISNVLYAGSRGVYSAMHHISDILELYKINEKNISENAKNISPVIQQKLSSLYEEEIKLREQKISLSQSHSLIQKIEIQKQKIKLLNKSIKQIQKNTTLIIPACLQHRQECLCYQEKIPQSLTLWNNKEWVAHTIDIFSEFVKNIFIIIYPNHRDLFNEFIIHRKENIQLVEQLETMGDGKAILDSLKYIDDDNCDVILAWADLIVASKERIIETIEKHYELESIMTFPTVLEKNPEVSIVKDRNNLAQGAIFSNSGNLSEYGEEDCSFFIVKYRELKESLRSLHSTYFDKYQNKYHFNPTYQGEEFEFLYIIEELWKNSKKVYALPIAQKGEFIRATSTIRNSNKK